MDFSKWEGVHGTPDQEKRLKSAKASACTPLSISVEEPSGVFSGSHGTYQTTLETCTCVDFIRRKLPCKHIYRLAIELGVLSETADSDVRKVKRPTPAGYVLRDAVAILEQLPAESLTSLKNVMYLIFYQKKREIVGVLLDDALAAVIDAGVLVVCDDLLTALEAFGRNEIRDRLICSGVSDFKKSAKHSDLAKWICDNVPDAVALFSDVGAVRISDDFLRASRKIYTYLGRRLDNELIVDGSGRMLEIPKGAEFVVRLSGEASGLSLRFPDDEITALLDEYGVNRCKGWTP